MFPNLVIKEPDIITAKKPMGMRPHTGKHVTVRLPEPSSFDSAPHPPPSGKRTTVRLAEPSSFDLAPHPPLSGKHITVRLAESTSYYSAPHPPPAEMKPQSKALPLQSNPFKLPANIFRYSLEEEEKRRLERIQERTKKPHEKMTFRQRFIANRLSLQQKLGQCEKAEEATCTDVAADPLQQDANWGKQFHNKDGGDRTSIRDFVADQRKAFRQGYSLTVKRETIQELKEIADQQDKELTLAEEAVKKNASTFNNFLKDCNIRLMETMKAAEEEVKAKQKAMAEMKEIQRQIMAVKSDISKNEEDLEEYNMYRDFLLKLSPPEWQEKQRIRKETPEKIKAPPKEWDLSTVSSPQPAQAVQPANRQNTESSYLLTTTKSQTPPQQNIPTEERAEPKTLPDSEGEDLEDFEDPQVYFTDHQQVLDIFESMAANNIRAIEKLAEEEETVEGLHSTGDLRFKKLEQEAAQLGRQIVILRETLRREIAKSADLKLKAKLFSFGEYKAEDQDLMLEKLRKKVSEVYRNCLGLGDGGQSAVQMLSTIEWRLYELLEQIEAVPRDIVLLVERAQAKERRVREREERVHLEKLAREELQRKMMARAMADIKKPTGKRLMPRSNPPRKAAKADKESRMADEELERNLYFFS